MITTVSGAISSEFKSNRLLQVLTLAYGLIWVVTAINPTNRFDWFLENLLVFLLWALLAASYGRLPFSNLSYLLIALFLGFHAVGAHYTYSETPLGAWLKDVLGEDRNHYDRAVHFLFGLMGAYPLREVITRTASAGGFKASLLAFAALLALSSSYEMIEWIVAEIVSPEAALAYLGTQGDVFDAQKDTTLGAMGAAVALVGIELCERLRPPRTRGRKGSVGDLSVASEQQVRSDAMPNTYEIRRLIEAALDHARTAELGVSEQTEHAVRALLQAHPEMSEYDAIKAVQRVQRPY